MTKTLSKVGIEGTYLNMIKTIYDKLMADIILNGYKLQMFPLISGASMSTFTSLIQHSPGSPSHSNQKRRKNKRHPNWNGRSQTDLFADDMILYIENHQDSTKKLLELIK